MKVQKYGNSSEAQPIPPFTIPSSVYWFSPFLYVLNQKTHSVIFRPILAKSEPFFGKLNNSVQSKYFFMISKEGSTTMIGLSCQTIMRSNQTSRLSSTTPGSEMSDMGNLDQQNQRFSRNSLYKSCSKYIQHRKKHHVWSSRHSCPPQIQLESKRTGAVLMRKMKDSQETYFTKLAPNNIQY